MEKINWIYLGYACILGILAQVGAWYQHNYQFLDKRYPPEWWGWYLLAIPLTWLFLKATYFGVNSFGGEIWPNRFVGFVLGIISYIILTSYHFKQPVTMKISVQLLLCFLILMVQIFWVEKKRII